MKPYSLLIAFALLLLAGCKDDFNIDKVTASQKLVVYCFPSSAADTTWIDVTRSTPVSSTTSMAVPYDADARELFGVATASVRLMVNGQEQPVVNAGGGRYYVAGRRQSGDVVEVSVSAPGFDAVTARAEVPQPVAISSMEQRAVRLYDTEIEQARDFIQLSATFADPADTRDYYAVRVVQESINGMLMVYTPDFNASYGSYAIYQSDRKDTWQVDSLVFYPQGQQAYYCYINTSSEPILESKTNLDDDFGYENRYYQNLYLFDDTAINGRTYTLRLNVSDQGSWWSQAFMSHYRVELFRISPQYYRFLRSLNSVANSDLAESGLAVVSPLQGNVSGGIGLVGGWTEAVSAWTTDFDELMRPFIIRDDNMIYTDE